jgi:hypothetical protein
MKQGTKPSDAAHEVGYGKPPKATRFRKGRSGNPKAGKAAMKTFSPYSSVWPRSE